MNAAEIVESYKALRAEYDEYAAEQRACGYEVEEFEDWAGITSPKARAQDRLQAIWDRDEWDLY